jgi:hypothetical protein
MCPSRGGDKSPLLGPLVGMKRPGVSAPKPIERGMYYPIHIEESVKADSSAKPRAVNDLRYLNKLSALTSVKM